MRAPPNSPIAECHIRCSGSFHRVRLSERGRVWFPDHAQHALDRELALADLGGTPGGCAKLLFDLRCGDLREIPQAIVAAVAARAPRRPETADPLAVPLPERIRRTRRKVRTLARTVLDRCDYRRVPGNHTSEIDIGEPFIEVVATGRRLSFFGWKADATRLRVSIPLSWYYELARRDLADVNGVFVLGVLEQAVDGSTLVLAGRPAGAFNVTTHTALITPKRALRWIDPSRAS